VATTSQIKLTERKKIKSVTYSSNDNTHLFIGSASKLMILFTMFQRFEWFPIDEGKP